MSSAAYNLAKKFEWMARRLRHIDDASEINIWIGAMTAINRLLKEFEVKVYSDDWKPWRKKGKKEMEIDNEFSETVLNARFSNDGDVLLKPQKSKFAPGTSKDADDVPPKGDQMLKTNLMPALRSLISMKSDPSSRLGMSRQRVIRRKKRGIKDVGCTENEIPTSSMDTEDAKEPSVEKKDSVNAKKKKIKDWWREALWRRLKKEDKAQEQWADTESFERLLCSSGEDKELTRHLETMFPKDPGNEFLLISKNELRQYLYEEMINFYLLDRK